MNKTFLSDVSTSKWIEDNLGKTHELLESERINEFYRTLVDDQTNQPKNMIKTDKFDFTKGKGKQNSSFELIRYKDQQYLICKASLKVGKTTKLVLAIYRYTFQSEKTKQ